MAAKILMLDIETAPKTAYVWGMWKQNVALNQLVSDGYVLCGVAKWLGDDHIYHTALNYYPEYKEEPENDKNVVESLWYLLDEADIVVAHNGKGFDIPVLNSRFVIHGMKPPSTYKIVDTLAVAKRHFRFTSNRLDALGEFLGVGRKIGTGGFTLWRDVLAGDKAAWKRMVDYCEQDVHLLEEVYMKLRAWHTGHPNVNLYGDIDKPSCNVCGSHHVQSRGYDRTQVSTFRRFQCQDCGHWMRERTNLVDKDVRHKILTSSK